MRTLMACSVVLLGAALAAPGYEAGSRQSGSAAASGRSVEIILDASGSMNTKLSGGGTKLEAAQAAVEKAVAALPADMRVAFRLHGHQSPRERHNCTDTELAVAFAPTDQARSTIVRVILRSE